MVNNNLITLCERYIQSGGVTFGSAFTNIKLERHMLAFPEQVAAQSYIDNNRTEAFSDRLFALIDRTGRRDSEIYKKALIDRRLFSKIRSNKMYTPAKKTVVALCLALELERDEADGLLSSAGYSLSNADDYDLIVAFCIEKKIFDLFQINEILYHFGQEPFI